MCVIINIQHMTQIKINKATVFTQIVKITKLNDAWKYIKLILLWYNESPRISS